LALELQTADTPSTVASHATFAPVCHELGIPFRLLDKTDVRSIAQDIMRGAPRNALALGQAAVANAPDAPTWV